MDSLTSIRSLPSMRPRRCGRRWKDPVRPEEHIPHRRLQRTEDLHGIGEERSHRGGARTAVRIALLPVLISALPLLSACMPHALVENGRQDAPESQVQSARTAAREAVRLEPRPPPWPLPEVAPPAGAETRAESESEEAMPARGPVPDPMPDVWARMRPRFSIPRPPFDRIQRQAAWLQRNQDYFDRVAERSRDFLPYIVREAERRGLPVELALLPVIESAFQPFAYSPARASGLWQFIPSTGRLYGLRINWWYDGRRDLVAATSAAFDYLEKLHRDFNEDWLLAVAAYNWGEGNLRKALARNRKQGKPLDFWALEVPAETRRYVPRWLALCDIVAHPEHYGMTLRRVPDEVTFRLVEIEHQIDLNLAAELADMSLDRLYRLNAGYRRWATEPSGPHRLLIPEPNADAFAQRVALLPSEQRVSLDHHRVVAGDTLSEIAERYGTSVAYLSRYNRLGGTLIRVGDHLLVPKGPTLRQTKDPSPEVRRGRARASGDTGVLRARRHRVGTGDSLWLIARRHRVRVADLVAWNRLDPEALLMPGQVLELRASRAYAATPATRDGNEERHIVRSGDNLWLIARRYGVSVAELRTWNRLDPAAWLMPGQVLELRDSERRPASALTPARESRRYVVRRGDSLWLIARRHSVSTEQLALWNRLPIDGVLRPGQTLDVSPPAAAAGEASTNSL